MTEAQKLYDKLKPYEHKFGITIEYDPDCRGGEQVTAYRNGKRIWDAVCRPNTYGYTEGLLELADNSKPYIHIVGWQKAYQIIRRLHGDGGITIYE